MLKYFSQHPIFKHPQPMFLPQCQRPSFTPIQNNRQNYSSVYYISLFIYTLEPAEHGQSTTQTLNVTD
jgi:hypothetical protein